MAEPFETRSARQNELAAAFGLVFQLSRDDDRDARILNAIHLVDSGQLDPGGIFVARAGSRVVGAMICQQIPGATALVWPPQTVQTASQKFIEDQLIAQVRAFLQHRRVKIAQALLPSLDVHLGRSLVRNGFSHLTSLAFLRHDLAEAGEDASSAHRFVAFGSLDKTQFLATLVRTYEGTRDCPEINGIRTPEEILEGHLAQGKHDPSRWWLVVEGDVPVGVLLLTEIPEWNGFDLSYLGIVPQARRRGLGRELTRKAIYESARQGMKQLTVSVDARNQPAWDLYTGMGFLPYDQSEVFLAIWSTSAASKGG